MTSVFDSLANLSHNGLGLIINGIWIGLVLTVLVWVALRFLRRLPASRRYLVWWTTLIVVLAVPCLMALQLNCLSWIGSGSDAPVSALSQEQTSEVTFPGSTDENPSPSAQPSYSQPSRIDAEVETNGDGAGSVLFGSTIVRFLPMGLALIWAIIVIVGLVRLWRAYRRIVGIKSRSCPLHLDRYPSIRRRLGACRARAVSVRLSSEIPTPMAAGLGRPTVLIPDKVAENLAGEDLEAIVLHEIAHLERWDDWTKLAQKIVEALFIFHPAVHFIGRQLELERELACDEWAVAQSGQVERYAHSLTRLVQLSNGGITTLIPGALTSRKQIFRRFERLLLYLPTESLRRARISTVSLIIGVISTALLLAGIAPAVSLPFKPLSLAELGGSSRQTSQSDQDDESGTASDTTVSTNEDTAVTSSTIPSTSGAISNADIEQLLAARNLSPKIIIDADWEAEFKRGRPWLHVTFYYERNSQSGFTLPLDAFTGIDESWRTSRADDVRFLLVRDAGVFDFKGGFKRGYGDGAFVFRVDEGYVRELDDMGYRVSRLNDRELFHLALFDVSRTFIKEMEELGYEGLSLERLTEIRIHGVKPETVRDLRDLGYRVSADRLVEFQIHGVTPWFIEELAEAGLKNLSAERLVEFRIHGVEADQVTEFRDLGLGRLSAEELVEFRIHRVTPDFVRDLQKQGYRDLSPDRLVEFRIHSVSPSMIDELRELGYDNLTPEELKNFSIHGVTPDFIRDLKDLGYDRVSPEDLISMRIHGVTPSYIKRMAGRGYDDLSIEDLIEFRIFGID